MAFIMVRLRFPGGLLFGAMAGSAVLHGTGYVHAVLPWWVGSSAVVMRRRMPLPIIVSPPELPIVSRPDPTHK